MVYWIAKVLSGSNLAWRAPVDDEEAVLGWNLHIQATYKVSYLISHDLDALEFIINWWGSEFIMRVLKWKEWKCSQFILFAVSPKGHRVMDLAARWRFAAIIRLRLKMCNFRITIEFKQLAMLQVFDSKSYPSKISTLIIWIVWISDWRFGDRSTWSSKSRIAWN